MKRIKIIDLNTNSILRSAKNLLRIASANKCKLACSVLDKEFLHKQIGSIECREGSSYKWETTKLQTLLKFKIFIN